MECLASQIYIPITFAIRKKKKSETRSLFVFFFLVCVSWRVSAQKLVRRQYEFLEYEFIYAANSNIIWMQFQTSIEQNTTSEHQLGRGMSDNIPMLKIQNKLVFVPMTYKFGTQKKQNTSFQKRESVFSFLKTRILPYLQGMALFLV